MTGPEEGELKDAIIAYDCAFTAVGVARATENWILRFRIKGMKSLSGSVRILGQMVLLEEKNVVVVAELQGVSLQKA